MAFSCSLDSFYLEVSALHQTKLHSYAVMPQITLIASYQVYLEVLALRRTRVVFSCPRHFDSFISSFTGGFDSSPSQGGISMPIML